MTFGEPPATTSYDVEVRRVISARLGGVIFAGLPTGPMGVAENRQSEPPRAVGSIAGGTVPVIVPSSAIRGGEPVPGEIWHVTGDWTVDGRFGRQFKAQVAYRIRPSGRLVVSYLANHVSGIGRGRAERLWTVFGDRLPDLLDRADIPALSNVLAPRFPALSIRLAADLVATWKNSMIEPAVIAWLDGLGVTDTRLVRRIVKILGEDTRSKLERNPYILAAFIHSWPMLDKLGLRLLVENRVTEPTKDIGRLVGAVDFVVRNMIVDEGHTVIDLPSLQSGLTKCLGIKAGSPVLSRAIRLGEVNGAILPTASGTWRAPGCAILEDGLARRFRAMLNGCEPSPIQIPSEPDLGKLLDEASASGTTLHPEQRVAALKCIRSPLALLMGGAGVGKTTTLRSVVVLWEQLGGRAELCALAGKAALRMSQATSRPARTIHQLLLRVGEAAGNIDDGERRADADQPLLDRRTLLIVDEASMVALGLWHRILDAMPRGCRLLMVGDAGQLPPVGFGLVFHILAQRTDIVSELTVVHRQSEAGGIPAISRAIRGGTVPDLGRFRGRSEGVFIVPCARHEILDHIEDVVKKLGGAGDRHGVQVVAPVNDGVAGVREINARFHNAHRKANGIGMPTAMGDVNVQEIRGYLGQWYAVGEPIVHRRNDYSRGLFNGSLGHVVEIDPVRRTLHAKFGEDLFEFGADALLDIAHAYCLSCHRLQGSQSDRVVVALYNQPKVVDLSWIYTAVTRAERQVVLVGEPEALSAALARPPAWKGRRVSFRLDHHA